MAVPLLMNRRALAAKIETTVGTAISIAAADATHVVFDPVMNPDTEYEDRPRADRFTHRKGTLGPKMGTLKFKTELTASVTGAEVSATNPAWATTFLPACGFVLTGNVASPVTQGPGGSGGVKTLTMGLYEDGVLKKMVGCMGTFSLEATAGKKIFLDWTFRGVWVAPADVAVVSPTYATCAPAIFRSSSLALGAYTPVINQLTLDINNQVEMRPDATSTTGLISAIVTGRQPKGKIDPETDLVANRDHYGIWDGLTSAAMSMSFVTGTRTVSFAAPAFQIAKLTEASRNGIATEGYDFFCNSNTDAGDDELTITFS